MTTKQLAHFLLLSIRCERGREGKWVWCYQLERIEA